MSTQPADIFTIHEGLPCLTRGPVRVEWVNLGDGNCGDFTKEDPTDTNLLRFDVSKRTGDNWAEVPNGSFCTLMPADAKPDELRKALAQIMNTIFEAVRDHGSAKRLCEELSWIGPKLV